MDDQTVALEKIQEGGNAERLGEAKLKNVNWMMKDESDRLYFACNTDGKNFPIYIAHDKGITKLNFSTDLNATFVEFGFLSEDKMFLLFNQGEKDKLGCYLLNLATHD